MNESELLFWVEFRVLSVSMRPLRARPDWLKADDLHVNQTKQVIRKMPRSRNCTRRLETDATQESQPGPRVEERVKLSSRPSHHGRRPLAPSAAHASRGDSRASHVAQLAGQHSDDGALSTRPWALRRDRPGASAPPPRPPAGPGAGPRAASVE